MAQTPIGATSFAALQQVAPGLQKANLASSKPALPSGIESAPSIRIDERLLSGPEGILTTGGRLGAVGPASREDARAQAREAQQQLSEQTVGIANQKPEVVQRLFR
ncbi:MAG: hypothetical protein FJX66_12810 [Alphaproteobacteria bacterium]|nr:hypothetical protein [Alphaproteobacteria bacterium]